MDSTPPSSKRMKTRGVKRGGPLEGWFSREDDKIEKYLHETSIKIINNTNLVTFTWLKEQKLMEVRTLLKEKILKRFFEMSGNIYPDLVRVFYVRIYGL